MIIRRYVIFQSESFNTTEAKDYFINECCFGDDLGRWLLRELSQRGVETTRSPARRTSAGTSPSTSTDRPTTS